MRSHRISLSLIGAISLVGLTLVPAVFAQQANMAPPNGIGAPPPGAPMAAAAAPRHRGQRRHRARNGAMQDNSMSAVQTTTTTDQFANPPGAMPVTGGDPAMFVLVGGTLSGGMLSLRRRLGRKSQTA